MSSPKNTSSSRPHILVFPFPAQGHMLALLDLAHQLSLHGLTITILVTPKNLTYLQPLLSANPSIKTLVLPFPPHPSVPSGVENVQDIGNHGNAPIISALTQLSGPITSWFKSHPTPPVCILSDSFLGWTQKLAADLGVPRICFHSTAAYLASVFDYIWSRANDLQPLDSVTFRDLPNSPTFPWAHLPSIFRRYRGTELFEVVKDGMIANSSSWGVVFNTFDDVESAYLEHFKKKFGNNRVWAVGPIVLLCSDGPEATQRGGPSSISSVHVFTWLDTCPDGSVVYVCFGSQAVLTRGQMESLCKGLEESGIRFILAVKAQTFVPNGFEDRVAGRGFVIKGWAPQASILSHRAVGGFLTHCGWNSVLEGIVAGVMFFAWPMEADQFIDAKLLVEDLRVAVRVCEGADTVPDSAALARVLSESMSGMGTEKVRAIELSERALGAVKEGGSSNKDLEGLVEQVRTLSLNKYFA